MGKKIAVLATDGFEDAELIYPFYRLKEAGHQSLLVSLQSDVIEGKHGYPIKPDLLIKDIKSADFDGVILPGGANNPDHLRRDEKVLKFVKEIADQGKLIAAICHAGWVLISAKVLDRRKATSYFAIKDDMINAGVEFEDSSVVVDNNLITSRMPADLPDFMREILKFLE